MSGNTRGASILWGSSANAAIAVYSSIYAAPATFDFGPVSATGHLTITADAGGAAGNNIRFIFADDGSHNTGVVTSVTGTGTSIDPYIATISFKLGTSTVKNLADLINADGTLGPLVTATYSGAGSALAVTATVTPLAGGYDAGVSGHPTSSSDAVNLGPQTAFALFIEVDGAATFRIQAAGSIVTGAGRNAIPKTDGTEEGSWYSFVEADAIEFEAGTAVVADFADEIIFSGAGALCIDFSPFSPTFLRLLRVDNNAGTVNVKAHTVAAG